MARVALDDDDDELITTAVPAASAPALLPLNQMQPNPENPRPSAMEVGETADDLRTRGQLQNINVMSLAKFRAQKPHLADQLTTAPFVVINGCRRLAAAPHAGLTGLKYAIHDDWSADDIDEAMISENEHRVQLNPLLLGRHLARMVQRPKYGGSERQLAKALSKQPAWVNHRIGLTKLDPSLQAAIEADEITFELARECPRLHPELQPKLASGELPTEVAKAWLVKLRIKAEEQMARWQAGPPFDVDPAEETEQKEPASRSVEEARSVRVKPVLVIRLMERSPASLATALREQLTDAEVDELVHALRTPTN